MLLRVLPLLLLLPVLRWVALLTGGLVSPALTPIALVAHATITLTFGEDVHCSLPVTRRWSYERQMARTVKVGLIQASDAANDGDLPVKEIQQKALDKHIGMIEQAAAQGVQILGLQEIFNGPYFCPGQDPKWYDAAEPIPGPTTEVMQELCKKHQMAMVVPLYEREQAGVSMRMG